MTSIGFDSMVRIAGTLFPASAALVQWRAELDRIEFNRRLRALEDPISALHEDVGALSEVLYRALVDAEPETSRIVLREEDYERFRHALAVLEARGLIEAGHTLMKRFFSGLRVRDPTYMLYLHALFGDPAPMDELSGRIEGLGRGDRLNGKQLREDLGIPLPVVNALFEVYEAKGYGLRSRTIGESRYIAKV